MDTNDAPAPAEPAADAPITADGRLGRRSAINSDTPHADDCSCWPCGALAAIAPDASETDGRPVQHV